MKLINEGELARRIKEDAHEIFMDGEAYICYSSSGDGIMCSFRMKKDVFDRLPKKSKRLLMS